MHLAISTNARIKAQTPLYNYLGEVVTFLSRDQVREKLADPQAFGLHVVLKNKTVRALQYEGPDPALSAEGSRARAGLGTPHRNDSYTNPAGVWTHDAIPERLRPMYEGVLYERGAIARRVPKFYKIFQPVTVTAAAPSLPL